MVADRLNRAAADEQAMLIKDKSYEHGASYLADLQAKTVDAIDVKIAGESVEAAVEATHVGTRYSRSFGDLLII